MSISDPGHLNNLTPDETTALARVWESVLSNEELTDFATLERRNSATTTTSNASSTGSKLKSGFKKLFSNSKLPEAPPEEPDLSEALEALKVQCEMDVKRIQEELLFAIGRDDPDLLVLRFLRARKWNTSKAKQMLLNCINWRIQFGVKDLLKDPEEQIGKELISATKSFIQGKDLVGRPVAYSAAHLHIPGEYPIVQEQRNLIFMLETGRQFLVPEKSELATIVFDFSQWTTKNQDGQFTKFLVGTLEAFYPESLGLILIVNAPGAFQLFWKIVKVWLDPVVREKVAFIKKEELSKFVDQEQIPTTFGGKAKPFVYIPLSNDEIKARQELLQDKQGFELANVTWSSSGEEFFQATQDWVQSVLYGDYPTDDDSVQKLSLEEATIQRNLAKEKLTKAFHDVSQWVIAPTAYSKSF